MAEYTILSQRITLNETAKHNYYSISFYDHKASHGPKNSIKVPDKI
jgi:hypothetical protein